MPGATTEGRAPVLVAGAWRPSTGTDSFWALNPATGERLGDYPVSDWAEIDACLTSAAEAADASAVHDPAVLAAFLEAMAGILDDRSSELVEIAHAETALPGSPRLAEGELPRTTDQLRQAAEAARSRSWKRPVISPASRIASMRESLPGVVCVFGPNNFPFAFNSIGGGDFAAAVATGHPVLGKANPGHPGTTRRLAESAAEAAAEAGLPPGFVQLVYRVHHSDGARLVADPRVGATAYTGSRRAGLALKSAAEGAGNLMYLELSSVNPVVLLPGAWAERGSGVVEELVASALNGTGQFCTSPGLIFVLGGPDTPAIRAAFTSALDAAPVGVLLGRGVAEGLAAATKTWSAAGATVITRAPAPGGPACRHPNTLMEVSGRSFLANRAALQTEAFGNMSLLVICADIGELTRCLRALEGNLTGSVYSASDGRDDDAAVEVSQALRPRVGRLLNDKVPTGVAVVPAMNHGGPYPATGHPGFTAVGIPASLERFTMLQCFDNVRDHRLPLELRADNPLGLVRSVDGVATAEPVTWG